MQKSYKIKSRIWITGKHGTFLGEGRIELLENIKKRGSISKAARSMKMSYKKAWEMINAMNNEAEHPLVIKESGGKNGGGTTLTNAGEESIYLYNQLTKKCQEFLNAELNKIYP